MNLSMKQLGLILRGVIEGLRYATASLLDTIITFLLYLLIKDDGKIILKQRHAHNCFRKH